MLSRGQGCGCAAEFDDLLAPFPFPDEGSTFYRTEKKSGVVCSGVARNTTEQVRGVNVIVRGAAHSRLTVWCGLEPGETPVILSVSMQSIGRSPHQQEQDNQSTTAALHGARPPQQAISGRSADTH